MEDWQRWIAFSVLSIVLIVAGVIDWRTEKIPNKLTMPAILFGLIFWTVTGLIVGGTDGAWSFGADALIAFLAGLIPFMVIILATGGLGPGDMKLMAALGAISGRWEVVIAAAFYGLLICALYAIYLMIRTGRTRRTMSRLFGAALLAGANVKADLDNDQEAPKVPYAVGACLGGILAAAEVLLGLPTPWSPFGMVG